MKYMILIYGNQELWESFPQDEIERVIAETNALQKELFETGEWLEAFGVADQAEAKTVRVRNGVPVVTDGPYIEAKEYLGSFDIVDCESVRARPRDRCPRSLRSLSEPWRSRPCCTRPGSRCELGRADRGPAALTRAAGPRCPRSTSRAVRRVRRRRAGGVAGGSSPVAARRHSREPAGWLITVASRRLADEVRSNVARRRREDDDRARQLDIDLVVMSPDSEATESRNDDTLTLLFLCCHPSLSPASQLALTLRAVGGLTTAEIAHAFLVPEATMGQRISRAKQQIRSAGATFVMPPRRRNGPSAWPWCCRCSTSSSTRATRRHPARTCSERTSLPKQYV